jgi:hypothetical protein
MLSGMGRPQGLVDVIPLHVMREPTRYAEM